MKYTERPKAAAQYGKCRAVCSELNHTSATGLEEEELWFAAQTLTPLICENIKQLLVVNGKIVDVKDLT